MLNLIQYLDIPSVVVSGASVVVISGASVVVISGAREVKEK